jgi:hypothetical protein
MNMVMTKISPPDALRRAYDLNERVEFTLRLFLEEQTDRTHHAGHGA